MDMPIIMGIPPHIIVIGMPADIIFIIASQRSLSMSIDMPSGGIILQVIPSLPISQDILHIIGMPMPIMFCIMPIMLGIMPIMLGIMPIMLGIMLGIMPIMLGIMPGIIGMPMPIMFCIMLIMFGIIGMPMPIMPGIMPIMPGIIGMPMPIMPGIIDAPEVISGMDIIGLIVCGIIGIWVAVVMGGPSWFSARCLRERFYPVGVRSQRVHSGAHHFAPV
ncbi:hypothetical protein WME89_43420 [Sorangium sp. So ce321]|uniref:hypothetical protein n=1 Tax=Sorangium sp. So ce321 TaxID=3133300 RepID=UPI003F6278FA